MEEDEDAKKKDKKMTKASQKRFGFKIQFDDYRTSNLIKILCTTLAVIIIPLEIFLQNVLQDREKSLIISIQSSFGDQKWLAIFFLIPI